MVYASLFIGKVCGREVHERKVRTTPAMRVKVMQLYLGQAVCGIINTNFR